MKADPTRTLTLAAVALVCVAGATAAAAAGLLARASGIAIYLLANLILTFDVLDLVVRIWLRRLHGAAAEGPSVELSLTDISDTERALVLSPYALVASVYNAAADLDRFTAVLLPFKDVVWLIDDGSDDTTFLRLRRDGWNCVAGSVNRNKPGALAHLLTLLPTEIQTVVILDPDIRFVAPPAMERAVLERVISDLQRSGATACTPRVRARRGIWLVECQALEYELACGLGRKSLRDLTCNSGVSVYQRAALQMALARHSLSIYAEDFETSILLLSTGHRIYYDDRLVIETRAKQTVAALFSQRVGWAFGGAKVLWERCRLLAAIARRSPLGAYQYLFYFGLSGVLLLPVKLASVFVLGASLLKGVDDLLMTQLFGEHAWNEPLLFGLWYVKATAILCISCALAVPRGERARHLGTVPFYSLYGLLQHFPLAVGYLNLLTLRAFGWRIYADHYERCPRLPRHDPDLRRSAEPV